MTRRGLTALFAIAAPVAVEPSPAEARAALPMSGTSDCQTEPAGVAAEPAPDHQPPARRVRGIVLSGAAWCVTAANDRTKLFRERNRNVKVGQGGIRPPGLGTPIILGAGMRGERALVIFSRPDDFIQFVSHTS